MDEDTIADLKQFIATTVSQQTTELGARMDRFEHRMDNLESGMSSIKHKVDDLTAFVTEAIDSSNEETGKQLKNYEQRITKLENA